MIILIKVVIFDIGGVTIKDPMGYIYRKVGKGFKRNKEDVRKSYYKLKNLAETGKISEREFWLRMAKRLEIKDVSLLEKVWMNALKKACVTNQKVVKIIRRVKAGYKVATLSNSMDAYEKLHRKAGHYRFFQKVFLSNRLGIRKPGVEIYLYVAKKLNVKPSQCVFIDDRRENVSGAKRAGMNAILFKDALQLEKDLKKYL